MEIETFFIEGPLLIKPTLFTDDRGCFLESFSKERYENLLGVSFVQDNLSRSKKNVLRGLHFQRPPMDQGKLVSVLSGRVIDVAVDIRSGSRTYGKHLLVELDAENHHQFYIPSGFAHGFMVLSESAEFLYKTTDYWYPEFERTLLWNDPKLGIDWPLPSSLTAPLLAAKDAAGLPLSKAETF